MTSEVEMREALQRGKHAEQILADDLVHEAIAAMRSDAFAKIESTKPGQKEEREYLYLYLKAIANFEAQLQFAIEEGRVAANWLDNFLASKRAAKRRPR